jgi:hypothetical protein
MALVTQRRSAKRGGRCTSWTLNTNCCCCCCCKQPRWTCMQQNCSAKHGGRCTSWTPEPQMLLLLLVLLLLLLLLLQPHSQDGCVCSRTAPSNAVGNAPAGLSNLSQKRSRAARTGVLLSTRSTDHPGGLLNALL